MHNCFNICGFRVGGLNFSGKIRKSSSFTQYVECKFKVGQCFSKERKYNKFLWHLAMAKAAHKYFCENFDGAETAKI